MTPLADNSSSPSDFSHAQKNPFLMYFPHGDVYILLASDGQWPVALEHCILSTILGDWHMLTYFLCKQPYEVNMVMIFFV